MFDFARCTLPNEPVPSVRIKVKFLRFNSTDDRLFGFRSMSCRFSCLSDKSTWVDSSQMSSLLLETDPNGVCGGECGSDSQVSCSIIRIG